MAEDDKRIPPHGGEDVGFAEGFARDTLHQGETPGDPLSPRGGEEWQEKKHLSPHGGEDSQEKTKEEEETRQGCNL